MVRLFTVHARCSGQRLRPLRPPGQRHLGSGLGRFVNPPYDLEAWASFRASVENQIAQAEKDCGCESESCAKGRVAMRDLRSLIDDLDTAIRTGAPLPSDVVQRQEAIDNAIP